MKTIDIEPAISLSQYIPFIDPSKPFVDFVETSVLSIVDIDEDLIEYYNNTVLYNLNEANPILKQSLKDINTAIRPLLSDENKSFNDAVRHYQVNLDSTKIH